MFTTFENALISKIKNHFGSRLKKVEGISGALSEETFKKQAIQLPGIFIRFIGFSQTDNHGIVKGRWVLFPIVNYATDRAIKKKGCEKDGQIKKLGMYELIEQLAMLLNEQELQNDKDEEFATVRITNANELFSAQMDSKGLVVWSLELEADLTLGDLESSDLSPFETFGSTFKEGEDVLATDEIKLEQ